LAFTVLTAARTGEVIGALKSEIDLDAAVWTIPAERMKSARGHRVPLSPAAVALAREAMMTPGDYLFSAMKLQPISNMAMLELLRGMVGKGLTVHGFRAAWAEDKTDRPREVIEAALAHTIGDKAEQAYRRSDAIDKRRALMDEWAEFLNGGDRKKVRPG
jgi:integrase